MRDRNLLHTRLTPPQQQRRVLPRPALVAQLHEALDYRVTIVQAGTGYSKTTTLAALDDGETPLFWYSVGEAEADPQRFLSYLLAAFRLRLPGLSGMPLAILQERGGEGNREGWFQALDALINALDEALAGPSLLVIDDFHLVADSVEVNALLEHLITYLPAHLHVIVSTRYPPSWEGLVGWRVRGELLEITRGELAFRPEEIKSLFGQIYNVPLSAQELAALVDRTEGWPIALQLVWQGLRGGKTTRAATDLLAQGTMPRSGAPQVPVDSLFDYLAREVLGSQPSEIAEFLRQTAVLREFTPDACDAVRQAMDSADVLHHLVNLDLFVVALGEQRYRYHHLFHEFLSRQLEANPAEQQELHRRAACYFSEHGDYDDAIYHWLAAGDMNEAAATIEKAGEAAVRAGWLGTMANWIDALPPEIVAEHPLLQALLGDVCRLQSRFDEALAWYSQAEAVWRTRDDSAGVSRALRGQALVYLDTVRPSQAQSLLEEALRLIDGTVDREARARLLELLAENKLNMGKPAEAEVLHSEARSYREEGPDEDALSVRVQLRTGRLDEAQHTLEAWLESERQEEERGEVHVPRAHRETLLILSLIHSLRGESAGATALAEEAIAVGERLGSPFVTAVAHMRLGHARQLQGEDRPAQPAWDSRQPTMEEAKRCYGYAIALGDRLAVRRIRAEAMWGLTRAHGFSGDLQSARETAREGVETGKWAGDTWITALIELALGASYVLAGQIDEALEMLPRVGAAFRDCGDSLGRAATRMWLSMAYHDLNQMALFYSSVEDMLSLCQAHGYDYLVTAPTLLSPPDRHRLVPVLLAARARGLYPAYVSHLLDGLDLPDIQYHPGYQLRVQSLGAFRVWRGSVEVAPRDWQRDKARQLFQLLLTERSRWLPREQIADRLWPQLSPEAAARDFKVALNALNKAIEPGHSSEAPFSFLAREGTSYQLRPEADLWVDSTEFERECEAGMRLIESGDTGEGVEHLQAAMRLYRGDYLPDALYEDWASDERERLLSLFLRAADRLAEAYVQSAHYDGALEVCQRILARDPCWERAYRMMMVSHARQGNRSLATRTYQRCVDALREELGAEPSPATTGLYRQVLQSATAD